MKNLFKYLIASLVFITTISTSAHDHAHQSDDSKQQIIDGDKLTEKEIYSLETEGWVIFKYQTEKFLMNFSNYSYILFLNTNCQDKTKKPGFRVEFNNNYRDGNRAGVDFASSGKNEHRTIKFLVDGKDLGNPFKDYEKALFEEFIKSLKQSDMLTMQFYDKKTEERYEPSSVVMDAAGEVIAADASVEPEKKDVLKLNREIAFMLKNGELLDVATDCE